MVTSSNSKPKPTFSKAKATDDNVPKDLSSITLFDCRFYSFSVTDDLPLTEHRAKKGPFNNDQDDGGEPHKKGQQAKSKPKENAKAKSTADMGNEGKPPDKKAKTKSKTNNAD